MSSNKSYTESKLSARPDYYVAGDTLDNTSQGYFEEPLSQETVEAFSEVPESGGPDQDTSLRKIRAATLKLSKRYRVAH